MPDPAGDPNSSNLPHAIVLFDGVCNLCSASVAFIIARDARGYFRFASLQSPIGADLLHQHGIEVDTLGSIVLIEAGRLYRHSTAALRIARRLDPPWPLLHVLMVLPRPLRDCAYRFIARHRYHWFGRRDACLLPTPQLRSRFL